MKEELAKLHEKLGGKKGGWGVPVDLEVGEKVEVVVKRSGLGVVFIWAGVVAGFVLLSVVLGVVLSGREQLLMPLSEEAMGYLYLIIGMLYVVMVVGGLVATVVYRGNYLVVTNQRVVQRTMTSLFARSLNVIGLDSVEDVSFAEKNVVDRVFHLGIIRMATVGDETTYTLSFVDGREGAVKKIIKLVHAVKGN